MKKILYLLFWTLPTVGFSQSFPPNTQNECFETPLGLISPWNWTKEYKEGMAIPGNLNYADWWELYARYNDAGSVPRRELQVPFITANQINLMGIYVSGELQQALAKADYQPEDGWVLLDFDFGFAEGSQTVPDGKVNPYLVMYNKYTN